jgi:hypothetical protein
MSLVYHSYSMAMELPYLPMVKNVPVVFEKIAKAKIPDAFTNSFLSGTLGLKSTNDRALIGLLKKMGFLDNSGKPTNTYALLKNKEQAKKAIADGIRRGYAKLFEANEGSHALSSDQLKGLVAQVSGTEENMTNLITGTFRALVALANFTAQEESGTASDNGETKTEAAAVAQAAQVQPPAKFHPEFRFNIEVHLPSNGTEETYLNIFNALRKALA